MESKLGYRIDLSDFWNRMLSGEISFSMGAEFVAQRLRSHLHQLNSDAVDFQIYGLQELSHLVIQSEELQSSIKNGTLNYAECRSKFSDLMTKLETWANTAVGKHARSEVKIY
jgi:hypothetical protein